MDDTPRSAYARRLEEDEQLLSNLALSFDPHTINALKRGFDKHDGTLELEEFILLMRAHLRAWQQDLPDRDKKMINVLRKLFQDIDLNGNNQLDWDEFTNYLVEKTAVQATTEKEETAFKQYTVNEELSQHSSSSFVERIVNVDSQDLYGLIEHGASVVKLYHCDNGKSFGKPLSLTPKGGRYCRAVRPKDALCLGTESGNRIVVSCDDGCIRSFDRVEHSYISANEYFYAPLLSSDSVQSKICWDPSEAILFGGQFTGQINLWKLTHSKPVAKLIGGHSGMVTGLVAVPHLQGVVSASQDKNIILWDLIMGKVSRVYKGHTKGILSLTIDRDQSLLFSAGFDHSVFVWNPYIDDCAFKLEGHQSPLRSVEVAPGKFQVVTADSNGWVKLWDTRTYRCMQSISLEKYSPGFKLGINDLAYVESRKRVLVGGRKLLVLDYDADFQPIVADAAPMVATHYSPYCSTLISVSRKKIKNWNAFRGKAECSCTVTQKVTVTAADDYMRRVILGTHEGSVLVYSIQTMSLMKLLDPHSRKVTCIQCMTEPAVIVTAAADLKILVHDDTELMATAVLRQYTRLSEVPTALTMTSTYLLTGGSAGVIRLWDLEEQDGEDSAMVHKAEITDLLLLHEQHCLVSADFTGKLCFWSLDSHAYTHCKLFEWLNPGVESASSSINCLAFDLSSVFLGDDDGHVKGLDISGLLAAFRKSRAVAHSGFRMLAETEDPIFAEDPSACVLLFDSALHSGPVKHLICICQPPTVVSTSADQTVKLVDALTGIPVGALQQGYKHDHSSLQGCAFIDWNFTVDTETLQKENDAIVCELLTKIRTREAQTALPKMLPRQRLSHKLPSEYSRLRAHSGTNSRAASKPQPRSQSRIQAEPEAVVEFAIDSPRTLVMKEMRRNQKMQHSHSAYIATNALKTQAKKRSSKVFPHYRRDPQMPCVNTSLPSIHNKPAGAIDLRKRLTQDRLKHSSTITQALDKT